MPTELEANADAIHRKLNALLAVTVQRLLVEDESLADPRPRNIDQLLADAGLRQAEIADLLGKTPQAVSQALARSRK